MQRADRRSRRWRRASCRSERHLTFDQADQQQAGSAEAGDHDDQGPAVIRSRSDGATPAPAPHSVATVGSASTRSVGAQPVSLAAHGLDAPPSERLVELAAQMPDVDLDDVRVAVEVRHPRPRRGARPWRRARRRDRGGRRAPPSRGRSGRPRAHRPGNVAAADRGAGRRPPASRPGAGAGAAAPAPVPAGRPSRTAW